MKDKMFSLKKVFSDNFLNEEITVQGFVLSARTQKNITFITIHDGTTFKRLQIVADTAEAVTVGSTIRASGTIVESPGKEQSIEMHAKEITVDGKCDPTAYPLQKKRHSFEFLRTKLHLRPRTNTQLAITRIRSSMAFASHLFFQERDFSYVQTPILTASDCEGSGELFSVVADKKNFFGKEAKLSVSGQLQAEAFALATGRVYTFGPTFRAENSHTARHLAEFWMIEPEVAFCGLQDIMVLAEDYVKFIIKYILENHPLEMEFFNKFIKKGHIAELQNSLKDPFAVITYSEAIDLLKKAPQKFEHRVEWGASLQAEHETFLIKKSQKPLFVIDYPEKGGAFYMKNNSDNRTIAAMDLLVPTIGELIGGSERETDLQLLITKMKERNMPLADYEWYLDLRRFGSTRHSGFGVGFERLVQYITGMSNIRDVIAYPRHPNFIEG